MKVSGIITLTTDFGINDPYVGMMKGVILSINPSARVVDITHGVKAGAVFQGAGLVQEAFRYFPPGTVHVAVVDPGVGTDRRLIVVATDTHLFVGPDNGLFWPIIEKHDPVRVIQLSETRYFLPRLSTTFHGRDIFAPVAAHLTRGVEAEEMGPLVHDPVKLHLPLPRVRGQRLIGQVVRVDHFGNLITNIHRSDLDRFLKGLRPVIKVGELLVQDVRKTYAECEAGEALAMIGSSEYLEVAVNLGRASDRLGADTEDIIGMDVELNRS
jgi:S-adenosylmethionine hydrolase